MIELSSPAVAGLAPDNIALRLTPERISRYVARLGGSGLTCVEATLNLLDLFEADNHLLFSRRDLTTILLGAGYPKQEVCQDDRELMKALKTRAVAAETRTWWSLAATPKAATPKAATPKAATPKAATSKAATPKVATPKAATLTMKWFEEQSRDKNLIGRCARLLARKRPTENEEDLRSHVGICLAKWGASGYCDAKIAAGEPPSISALVVWMDHKWSHDEYRRAKDALHRGAGKRTQSEIRHRRMIGAEDYVSPGAEKGDPDAPEIAWKGSEDDTMERDFVAKSDPSELIFNDQAMDLVRDLIRVKVQDQAADRYVRFAEHMFAGRSKEETAEIEGCSELRVTHLFQRVRDSLREAPVLLQVALKVLDLVTEEPYSTQDEIVEEIPDAMRALKLLALRGLVAEGSGRSFTPTNAGRNALRIGSLV